MGDVEVDADSHLAGFQPGVHQVAGSILHEADHNGRGQDIHAVLPLPRWLAVCLA